MPDNYSIKKKLNKIVKESDFEIDPEGARAALEQEEIINVLGAGTYTREAVRKKLKRYCERMGERIMDPEEDRNFQAEFTNFVSWADAVLDYDPNWERTKGVLKRVFK